MHGVVRAILQTAVDRRAVPVADQRKVPALDLRIVGVFPVSQPVVMVVAGCAAVVGRPGISAHHAPASFTDDVFVGVVAVGETVDQVLVWAIDRDR